jgi:HK97 family phage prohead protease
LTEPEYRARAGRIEVREQPGSKLPKIRGYAAVYGVFTTLAEDDQIIVRERVQAGAFDKAIREGQDIRALFNHNPDLILGRTKSGTLRVWSDSHGLAYGIDPPDTTVGRNMVEAIRRGDVSQSSFAFNVREGGQSITRRDDRATGKRVIERTLTDLDLLDVSPVSYPAYPSTSVSVRFQSIEDLAKRERIKADMHRRGERLRMGARLMKSWEAAHAS